MFLNITGITTALSALSSLLSGHDASLHPKASETIVNYTDKPSALLPTLGPFNPYASNLHGNSSNKRAVIASGTELRILPLGASITVGHKSSDDNGYRLYLQNLLSGSDLQYVGTNRYGSMKDNWNEAHSGFTIDQVKNSDSAALALRPNIILLHVGTNDLGYDPKSSWTDDRGAADRLAKLIEQIMDACPDAVLMVAMIVGTSVATVQKRYNAFNSKIPKMVGDYVLKTKREVRSIDMTNIKGDLLSDGEELISLGIQTRHPKLLLLKNRSMYLPCCADLKIHNTDGVHPNDAGYSKMADLWFNAIQIADYDHLIKPPVNVPNIHPSNPTCISKRAAPAAGELTGHFCREPPKWAKTGSDGRISHGAGSNGPAKFKQNWLKKTRAGPGIGKKGQFHVKFADITGNGRSDFVWVDDKTASLVVYGNAGQGSNIEWKVANGGKPVNTGTCQLNRLRFATLTTSGKPDYICIDDATGRVDAWFNGGGDSARPGGWKWTGPTRISEKLPGGTRDSILFADMNGDGLDDMLVRGSKGELDLWLNIWKANSPKTFFQSVGRIATGTGTANKTLADLNNDGRADIIIFNGKGAASGFLNVRGQKEGFPVWKEQKSIAAGVGVDWRSTRMVDLTGDGKAEFVYVRDSDSSLDIYVNNAPIADTSVVGDGTFFADFNGDGLDDKHLIDENGQIISYINSGRNAKAPYGWLWLVQNNGMPIALGVGAKRKDYRWADVDGDGKADMLIVDPNTGSVKCLLNKGPNKAAKPRGWVWDGQGQIAPSYGDAAGVFFGDVDGDGLADLLWISKTSQITIYLNDRKRMAKPAWNIWRRVPGVLDFNAGYRRDIRIADVNGDAKADIIWVHPIDGSAVVWINNDYTKGKSGWSRQVPFPKEVAPGRGFAGINVHFARIHIAHGRADYVAVAPATGAAYVWKNVCDNVVPGAAVDTGTSLGNSLADGLCDLFMNPDPNGDLPGTSTQGSGGNSGTSTQGSGGNSGSGGGSGGESGQSATPEPDTPLIPFITVGDSTFTANSATQAVIGGQTLTPGGQITVGGTTISLDSDGGAAVVGGTIQTVGHAAPDDQPLPGAATLSFGGSVLTADASSQFIVDGQTLTPNGVITVAGTPISLGSTAVIAGSITQSLTSPTDNPVLVLTFGDSSITANSNSQFLVGGQTLTPGGTITVSGTPIQLGSDGSAAVFGTSTEQILLLPPSASPAFGPTVTGNIESAAFGPSASPAFGPTVTGNFESAAFGPSASPAFGPTGTGTIESAPFGGADQCTVQSFGCGHGGFDIPGFTTIPSPTRHAGSRPTSGHGAFVALQPFAALALGSVNAVLGGIAGLGRGGGPPSSQAFASLANSVGTAIADLSSLGADLDGLLAPGGGLSSETLTINAGQQLSMIVTAVDTTAPESELQEAIELVTLDPDPPEIATIGQTITESAPMIAKDVQVTTTAFQKLLTYLRGCISKPSDCTALLILGAAALGAAFGGGVAGLANAIQRGVQNLASQSTDDTTSTSCSSRVVTDYWVSCTSSLSGKASCETTSSSLATGCDVTATTTTTSAAACSLNTDDPFGDEGEDGNENPPTSSPTTTTTTLPPASPTTTSIATLPPAPNDRPEPSPEPTTTGPREVITCKSEGLGLVTRCP